MGKIRRNQVEAGGTVVWSTVSGADQTSNSTSWVNITNGQTSITVVRGNPVVIIARAMLSKSSTSFQGGFGVAIDGDSPPLTCDDSCVSANVPQCAVAFRIAAGLSIGSHILNARMRVADASVTIKCHAYQSIEIMAYEL
jgi:hypothetical protein